MFIRFNSLFYIVYPYITSIVKVLSTIGLIFANLITYLFLSNYLLNVSLWGYLLLIALTGVILRIDISLWLWYSLKKTFSKTVDCLISIPKKIKMVKLFNSQDVLKANTYILILQKIKKKITSLKHAIKGLLHKIIDMKFLFVSIRLLFFNTFYDLFSVYAIWLSLLGLVHITKIYTVQIDDPNESFFELSAILGIFLGIFQFVLQRNDEKIDTKINSYSNLVRSIIYQETQFTKFYKMVSDDDNSLKDWISKNTDPKLQLIDFFKSLTDNKDFSTQFFRLMNKKNMPFSINMAYPDSNKQYEILDVAAEHEKDKKEELHKLYHLFFVDEERINQIYNKIDEKIDINEFRFLALRNINIISEILPKFITYDAQKMASKIGQEEKENVDEKMIEFESSEGYIAYLNEKISGRVLGDLLK